MTTATRDRTPVPLPSDQAVSAAATQATIVEQSRAVAEVAAAVRVAQEVPRDLGTARAQMRDSCQQAKLAERAFFRFSRAGGQVSGASVHLARELARCWGNVQYGITELRRDDRTRISEMQAFAWDVQTNTRSVSTFIVPHGRDTKQGRKDLTDLRDIYENNANQGARRVREAIFAVLPSWFTEEAQDICQATIRDGGGKPIAQRIDDAVRVFGDAKVTEAQLEAKVGKPRSKWDEHDVARLSVIFTSMQRGEVQREDEFPEPEQRVTAAEVTGKAEPDASANAHWDQPTTDAEEPSR